MKIKFLIFFLLTISFAFSQEKMSDTEAASFKKEVEKKANAITTMQSDFVQQKSLSYMQNPITSEGQVYYKEPKTLKWSYIKPDQNTIVFKDGSLVVNNNGKSREIKLDQNKMFENLIDLLAQSMNGKILNNSNFEADFEKKGNQVVVTMSPLDDHLKEMFKNVEISFNSDYTIKKVRLIDLSDDVTEITFSNMKINQPIDNNVFKI